MKISKNGARLFQNSGTNPAPPKPGGPTFPDDPQPTPSPGTAIPSPQPIPNAPPTIVDPKAPSTDW